MSAVQAPALLSLVGFMGLIWESVHQKRYQTLFFDCSKGRVPVLR